MIKFDYQKIWLAARGDPYKIIHLFCKLVEHYDLKVYDMFKGNNFIMNEYIITENYYSLSVSELSEYLGLCSLRPLQHYVSSKEVDLSLELFPDYVPRDVVDNCKMVNLVGKKLIFKYETQE